MIPQLVAVSAVLGSVGALVASNTQGVVEVVERYVYDPYGQVTIMTGTGGQAAYRQPGTVSFDKNLDGQISGVDSFDLAMCRNVTPTDGMCVFHHDYDGDGEVTIQDQAIFQAFGWIQNGPEPPPEWHRTGAPSGDADNDGDIDLFDFHAWIDCSSLTAGDCLAVFDVDFDEDIDLADYTTWVNTISGPNTTLANPETGSRYGNPFLFTSQRYDATTNLYHFWARTYSPTLGRWLQQDRLGILSIGGGNPSWEFAGKPTVMQTHSSAAGSEFKDSMNLFLYVRANPLTFSDDRGEFAAYAQQLVTTTVMGALFGAVGGGIGSAINGDSIFHGAVGGAIAGGFGGAAGFVATSAFAGSASGLFATFLTKSAIGGVDGAVGAFAGSYHDNRDLGTAIVDSLFGFAVGAATGGAVDLGGKYLRTLTTRLSYSTKRLQHMFSASGGRSHAAQFGVSGTWSKQNGELLKEAIDSHVRNAAIPIPGTYRGTISGTHWYDGGTGLWVFETADGAFHVGWRLSSQQTQALLHAGNIQ